MNILDKNIHGAYVYVMMLLFTVWRSLGSADLKAFGEMCLGACELFRPAVLVTQGPVSPCLAVLVMLEKGSQ